MDTAPKRYEVTSMTAHGSQSIPTSSTDATTTDGFRVGRRVRLRREGTEGVLVESLPKDVMDRRNWWTVRISERNWTHHEGNLELLPDDAPTTPEPRFKPGDEVTFRSIHAASVIGQGRPSSTGEATWHIRFPEGSQTSALDGELVPAVAYEPREPEAVASGKPHYYAKLRDAGCEPWRVLAACHGRDWAIAYNVGTAMVYLMRCREKHDSPDDDIRKAHAHLAEAVRLMDRRTA